MPLEYWITVRRHFVFNRRKILQISDGVDQPNGMVWPLVFTLFICWVACYFCIFKGVQWTGKVSGVGVGGGQKGACQLSSKCLTFHGLQNALHMVVVIPPVANQPLLQHHCL